MSIRFASDADTAAVKEIWNKCFGDGEPFLSWNFSRNYNPGDTLIWIENGAVAATLQMQAKNISLWNKVIPGNYIFGIATLPEYRNRGIAKALLERAFEVARERGQIISLLIPFNYRFYEKFGYKMCYKLVKASIKKENAPKSATQHIMNFADVNDGTVEILQHVYRKFCSPLNGWIVRSDNEFQLILENEVGNFGGSCIVCRTGAGEYAGYAIGKLKNGKFSAYEMAYVGSAARDSMIAGIFEMFDDCENIEVTSPPSYCDDLISMGGYLDYSKICPFAMTKILNKEKFRQIFGENKFFCEDKNYVNMLFS